MPRVRKLEEDLVIKAYPEGQLIFEGQGLRLLQSREKDISLIESAIEGKGFVGYVGSTDEPFQYTSKLRAGESHMIIKQHILLFDHIMSDEHTRRRIPFPFEMNSLRDLTRIIPMDENHLLFTIGEIVNDRYIHRCYILNVITEEYRCIGNYNSHLTINSNYILLKKYQDDTTWHYNFSVDDMDEAHEPDIEQFHGGVHLEHFGCLNSDCIFSVRFRDKEIDELIIFDCRRNQVNLTERFPQLKGLIVGKNFNFALLTLTQNVLSMVLIDSVIRVIHIENGELKMSEGEKNFSNVLCNDLQHIDLNDNSFHHEDCVFYGVDRRTKRYGPIKFRETINEVMCLKSLQPTSIIFDGIAEIYVDSLIRYYFFYKERKLIVLHGLWKLFSRMRYKIQSVQPNEGDDFFVLADVISETGTTYVKLRWNDSEPEPITTILPHCGTENCGFIQGLPVNVERLEDRTGLVYLGSKLILDLPPNIRVISVNGSHFDNSACIVCDEAIHFFQFNVNGYNVEVQKHIVFKPGYTCNVYFNPRLLAETPDHQLFVIREDDKGLEVEYLHCLDWSTGSFLEPVLLYYGDFDESWEDYHYQESEYDSDNYYIVEEGHSFCNFVGDSYIHVVGGIIKAYVKDGAIKTHFFTNNNLPYSSNMRISNDPNLPNNVIQDMSYEEETKTMVLKTYNVEEDPESMNPTVERFHLPSFMAEASIFEYHMPD
ncbi:hypothetical protein PCE1_001503 [Barthelona sp. PCE]